MAGLLVVKDWEWAFDGWAAGLLLLVLAVLIEEVLRRRKKDGASQPSQTINAGANSTNYQAGRDITFHGAAYEDIKRAVREVLAEQPKTPPPPPADVADAMAMAEYESRLARFALAEAINALPEQEMIVVTLMYYEGLTPSELAKVLGTDQESVEAVHEHAILLLREATGLEDPSHEISEE